MSLSIPRETLTARWRNTLAQVESMVAAPHSPLSLRLLANHFPPLHGLRVLAIVSVIQLHVTVTLGAVHLLEPSAFTLASVSVWFGMDLFFILSGFLIGTLLLPRENADDGQNTVGLLRFYVRRAFRIVPLYYVVLTGLALTQPMPPARLEGLLYEYAYLTNYHAFSAPAVMPWAWSLAVEEHFYLVVPLVFVLLGALARDVHRIAFLVVLWILGFAVRYGVYASASVPWTPGTLFDALYLRTHTRFDILVAGVLLAYVQSYYGPRLRAALADPLRRGLLAMVPLSCLVLLVGPLAHRSGLASVFSWGTLTSVMYFALIVLLLNTDTALGRWLGRPFFLRIATLGYGMYLVHPVLVGAIVSPVAAYLLWILHAPGWVVWCTSLILLLVLSVLTAYLLHLVVEKPALWLRDRFAS